MFECLSKRALQVVFATRVKAGERGADALDVGDLVLAIILEDQDKLGLFLAEVLETPGGDGPIVGLEPHPPFFSAESASDLLVSVEGLLSHSTSIPTSDDLPVSADLARVFELAEKLRNDLQHSQVEPLHLLAAILEEKSDQSVHLLERAGITKEAVLAKLKG